MIKVNRERIIQNSTMVEILFKIMSREEAKKLVNQLEAYQRFQEEMQKQLKNADGVQNEFEKKMDKERFLEKFKELHFDFNYSLPDAIEEAKKEVDLTEEEITEILEIIVKTAV